MSKIRIVESEMEFGEYNTCDVFEIEKSVQYCEKLKQEGIKISEFILYKNNKFLIVEAKKTCPNFSACRESDEKYNKYLEYIDSIVSKFKNSLQLYISIYLNRYSQENFELSKKDYVNAEFMFVLVVKNAESIWLEHYQNVLRTKLNEEMKIWKIKQIMVINEGTARDKKLII